MNEYNEDLLEPLKYYRENLKDAFYHVTESYFQNLVKESHIDINKNNSLIEQYNQVSQNKDDLQDIYSRFCWLKNLVFILGIGAFIYGAYQFIQNQVDIIVLSLCGLLLVSTLAIYWYWIKPKINSLEEGLSDLELRLQSMRQEGYEMMKPLNDLFHSEMTVELIKQAIPFIHLDSNFNIERYEQLVKEYGFLEREDVNNSTLDIISGDILGNPFVFVKRLIHWMGTYKYEGSRVVTYTEHYLDSQGKRCSRQVSETLYAEVEKPGPYYSDKVSLIYGNSAAPNLTFHRNPTEKGDFNLFGNNQLKKKIDAVRKKSKQALQGGGTFQALANEEFDAQFNALDRDNEVEFRLLFTPLAQSNYQDIFENSPYGDDFIFNKECKINEIETENSQNWDFDTAPSQYYDFSFSAIKEKFISFNCNYFEYMYFSFLPLLAIPLYQQMASDNYIYGKSYDFQYNDYMTEMIANKMEVGLFVPPDADTRAHVKTMLKTSHYKTEANSEIIKVDAHSYKTVEHVDYVPVRAGNGKTYDVPVHWEEYVPVTKEEFIEVAEVKSSGNDFTGIKGLNHYQASDHNRDGSFAYEHFMAGKLYRKDQSLLDLLNDVYQQYGGSVNGKSTR